MDQLLAAERGWVCWGGVGSLVCLSLPAARLNGSWRKRLCTQMLCLQESEQFRNPSQGAARVPPASNPCKGEGFSAPVRCPKQPRVFLCPLAPCAVGSSHRGLLSLPWGAPPQSGALAWGSRGPLLPRLPHRLRLQAPWGGVPHASSAGLDADGPPGLSCLEAALGSGGAVGGRKPSEARAAPVALPPSPPAAKTPPSPHSGLCRGLPADFAPCRTRDFIFFPSKDPNS